MDANEMVPVPADTRLESSEILRLAGAQQIGRLANEIVVLRMELQRAQADATVQKEYAEEMVADRALAENELAMCRRQLQAVKDERQGYVLSWLYEQAFNRARPEEVDVGVALDRIVNLIRYDAEEEDFWVPARPWVATVKYMVTLRIKTPAIRDAVQAKRWATGFVPELEVINSNDLYREDGELLDIDDIEYESAEIEEDE